MLNRSRSSRSKANSSARLEASTIETGSSATMNCGRRTRARAMPSRCRWPPDNRSGYLAAISWAGRRRTSCRTCNTRSRRSWPVPIPWITSGSATLSYTVINGSMLAKGSWKMAWALRLKDLRACGDKVVISVSPKRICPSVILTRPNIARPNVVFPLPDSPTTATTSPACISSVTPSTAWTDSLPKRPLRTLK